MGSLMSGVAPVEHNTQGIAPVLDANTTPQEAREAFRHGVVRPTCGIARGFAQANMIAGGRDTAAAGRESRIPLDAERSGTN